MLLEDLSRFQFAFTAMFHMTFPAITVGLSVFLTIVYAHYWRTGSLLYLQMFRFWLTPAIWPWHAGQKRASSRQQPLLRQATRKTSR